MKTGRGRQVVIGLVLLLLGALFLVNNLTPWDLSLGTWWPAILIVVGLANLVRRGTSRWSALVVTALGVAFLLDELEVWTLSFEDVWRFWPVILLLVGIRVLSGGRRVRSRRRSSSRSADDTGDSRELNVACVFSGTEQRVTSSGFSGGRTTAIFGVATVDLRDAGLANGEATIDVTALFGGVTFRVPDDWAVGLQTTNVLGGSTDERPRQSPAQAGNRLVITGICLFGGITIES